MTDLQKISNLLTLYPLYKKIEVTDQNYALPTALEDITFSFYCTNEKGIQTFKLTFEPKRPIQSVSSNHTSMTFEKLFDYMNQEISQYDFTQHYSGTCQFCKKYKVNFLIHIESTAASSNILVKKIGQLPAFEISPDKDLISFLNKEDQDNYRKALICISQNYGIGAFAYLRRIVENEIIRIIQDISKLENSESKNIKFMLVKYEKNHQMTKLIDGIYNFLPNSLKSLGNNPIKVLHSQLSGGIHEFSEDECFSKAEHIDTLLRFVIKKINEESSDVKSARDALKNLI